jgi:hypothetical protein
VRAKAYRADNEGSDRLHGMISGIGYLEGLGSINERTGFGGVKRAAKRRHGNAARLP